MSNLKKEIDIVAKATGGGRILCEFLARQVYRSWVSYGLRRDLSDPVEVPTSRVPLMVRELEERDIPELFSHSRDKLDRHERLEVSRRLAHIAERIPKCLVAVDLERDKACFIQWLMGPEQNQKIQKFFKGRFPLLAEGEALLENAYTPVDYRGQGIMSRGMYLVVEKARELGYRSIVTFVSKDNTASLKGCAKAGFHPYLVRHDTRLLFHLISRRRFSAHHMP